VTPISGSAGPACPILIVAPPAEILRIPVPDGWRADRAADVYDAIAVLRLSGSALICLSTSLPDADAAMLRAAIAAMPAAPPVLRVDPALPPPDVRTLARLAVPPALPPPSDPLTRLAALLGRDGITRLLTAFQGRLHALAFASDPYAVGEGTTPATLAHRVGGLAGTLDFAALSAAWLRVESDGERHLPRAWDETRIAIAMLDRMLAEPAD